MLKSRANQARLCTRKVRLRSFYRMSLRMEAKAYAEGPYPAHFRSRPTTIELYCEPSISLCGVRLRDYLHFVRGRSAVGLVLARRVGRS